MKGSISWLGPLLLAALTVKALEVTPGSDCAALCSDVSSGTKSESTAVNITSSDIVCQDGDFSSTSAGIKFRSCTDCLQDSKATKGSESDVYWLLYNLRYAFDVCLYSFPKAEKSAINSPCNIDGACASLQDALETSLLTVDNDNQFDFCTASNSVINGTAYHSCTKCLQSTSTQTYLSNFLVALNVGCQQKPKAGSLLSISGEIFSSSPVNSTLSNNATLPGDGGAKVGSMTTGTIVGIAVGCGLLILGGLSLIFAHCRRQRRYNGEKIESPEPDDSNQPGAITTIHKGPHFASHEMSQSIGSHHASRPSHSRTLSNADYYQQMEQDRQDGLVGGLSYHYPPHAKTHGPNGAIPAHPAYVPRVVSRNSVRSSSPPGPPRTLKPNIADSYALRIYLKAAEDSGVNPDDIPRTLDGHHSRSSSSQSRQSPAAATRQEAAAAAMQAPLPPPPPRVKSKIPSLVLPSLPKIKVPKMYTPPQVVVQDATPVSASGDRSELRISRPLAVLDSRFQDRPLGGGPVMATEAPASFNNDYLKQREANASPMLSGGSSKIYG